MTRQLTNRRTAAAIAATLALGIAAPAAGARPIDLAPTPQPTAPAQTPATTVHVSTSRPAGSDISDLGYVAIGSGVTALALISVGGTRAATRRRRPRTTVQARVAA